MVNFTCENCGKELKLEKRIYEKTYEEKGVCLDCRQGAGRPSLGVTKKVSITLSEEMWDKINEDKGKVSMSGFLREMIEQRYQS